MDPRFVDPELERRYEAAMTEPARQRFRIALTVGIGIWITAGVIGPPLLDIPAPPFYAAAAVMTVWNAIMIILTLRAISLAWVWAIAIMTNTLSAFNVVVALGTGQVFVSVGARIDDQPRLRHCPRPSGILGGSGPERPDPCAVLDPRADRHEWDGRVPGVPAGRRRRGRHHRRPRPRRGRAHRLRPRLSRRRSPPADRSVIPSVPLAGRSPGARRRPIPRQPGRRGCRGQRSVCRPAGIHVVLRALAGTAGRSNPQRRIRRGGAGGVCGGRHGGSVHGRCPHGGLQRAHSPDRSRPPRLPRRLGSPAGHGRRRSRWDSAIPGRDQHRASAGRQRRERGDAQLLAIGDTTNVAARLQSFAPPGSVVLGQKTYDLVRASVDVRSLGTPNLEGKSVPTEVFELIGLHTNLAVHRDQVSVSLSEVT